MKTVTSWLPRAPTGWVLLCSLIVRCPLPGVSWENRGCLRLPVASGFLVTNNRNQCLLMEAVKGLTKCHWVAHIVSWSTREPGAVQPRSRSKVTQQKRSSRDATAIHTRTGQGHSRGYLELGGNSPCSRHLLSLLLCAQWLHSFQPLTSFPLG